MKTNLSDRLSVFDRGLIHKPARPSDKLAPFTTASQKWVRRWDRVAGSPAGNPAAVAPGFPEVSAPHFLIKAPGGCCAHAR